LPRVILNLSSARSQYDVWLAIARRAQWGNPEEVEESHPRASILKAGRVVFNIKGNDYRLVAGLQFQAGVLVIPFFGSHAEYDRIDAGDSLMDATVIVIDNDAELPGLARLSIGQKQLSLAMVQRLRARFGVPAALLLPPATKGSSRRSEKRAAA
jgi:mRNA interferase HigB